MTVRLTLGLAILALGFGLAALAGIPAMIENRSVGDIAVVSGLALADAGFVVGLTGIPAEIRAWRRQKADRAADIANLKVKRRRIQHTKADVLIRLEEAHTDLEKYRADRRAQAQTREQQKYLRAIELEDLIIEANLDFNSNDFIRHGVMDAFDRGRET
ncbi:hypothetical protein [Cryobacterium glucosi]|uniref:Uncharacterized protein n=1 Tax=Cryobacterium glucosi TaxID=1259175 RepID=A0ABY2IRW0_9MICO|nr:hypothetical protein [Cryobacterium glucosi]TFC21387.1 hypothetical protein E3O46_07285 [Cryobacterium glucosi]